MDVDLWVWAATITAILVLIALDFVTVSRNPHEVSLREAATWSILYIAVALAFGVLVWIVWGGEFGTEYLAGWLVEKSLSVDNLFVFVIIMSSFAVPPAYQHRVLLFGVSAALVMRAIFIAIGAAAIQRFAVTFLLFGGLLIWTAVQLFRHRDEDPEVEDNPLLRWARRRLPATDRYDGARLTTTENGRRVVTPLFFVFLAIGTTDLLFALDSIPAVFGVTQEPYLVFAANAFALLGLRALYFLLRGLLDRLVFLSTGLAVILAFIGVKLILAYLHEVNPDIPHVPTSVSLVVILGILTITTVASIVAARRHPERRAHAGRVRGDHPPGTDIRAGDRAEDAAGGGGA